MLVALATQFMFPSSKPGFFNNCALFAQTTVIVAVMEVWILQKYGKMPGCVKVRVNVCPGFRFPLSNSPEGEPGVPLVTVWVVLPLFVHVTDVPTAIVRFPGVN